MAPSLGGRPPRPAPRGSPSWRPKWWPSSELAGLAPRSQQIPTFPISHSGVQSPQAEESRSPMEEHEDSRFLTVTEVAATLRVSNMTVYRLINTGSLAAVRIGKSVSYTHLRAHETVLDLVCRLLL